MEPDIPNPRLRFAKKFNLGLDGSALGVVYFLSRNIWSTTKSRKVPPAGTFFMDTPVKRPVKKTTHPQKLSVLAGFFNTRQGYDQAS